MRIGHETRWIFFALSFLVSLAPVSVSRAAGPINEVIDCALRSLPPSVHGRFVLNWRSAKGEERRVEGQYWGEQPTLGQRRVIVASSGSEPGARAAYLFTEGDRIGELWRWLPGQGGARRIQALGSDGELFGTDVDFEDFARFARFLFPGQLRRLDDAVIGGRIVYVVETRPSPNSGSEYQRLLSSVDKDWCVILRREGYDAEFEGGTSPRKVLSADPNDVKHEAGFARVTKALLQDRRDGSETRVQLEDLDLAAELPDDFFVPERLEELAK